LEITHQKAAEVHARRNRRSAHRRRVVLAADPLRIGIKLRPVENFVQPTVEGVAPPNLQLARLHPEGSLFLPPLAQRHAPIIRAKHSCLKMFRKLYRRAAKDISGTCRSNHHVMAGSATLTAAPLSWPEAARWEGISHA